MPELSSESIISRKRFEALSDAVFAITMTLMILDLKVPQDISAGISSVELSKVIFNILVSAESYVVSFIILGIFWVRQQAQFDFVRIVDTRVLFMNLFFLLVIGFIPFSVSLIRHYPHYELSYVVYISNLLLISLVLLIHWYYASKGRNVISGEVTPEIRKKYMILSVVPIFIFALAMAMTFVNKRLAILIIYMDPLFYFIYRGLKKK